MKISIGSKIVEGPWGGGNLFAINLSNYLKDRGHEVFYDLSIPDIDLILLTDPRSRSESSSTYNHLEIEKYKQLVNPNVAVIQRINECDERKNTDNINQYYLNASNVADQVVFVSTWLRNIYVNIGMKKEKTSVILAGANQEIFNREKNNTWNKNSPLKIVTHHWSSHKNKGFDIYKKIDEMVGKKNWKNRIEFTYIGNMNNEYTFNHSNIVEPLAGNHLATELKKHHLYVTASINEPSGNHHIEAAQCGLPILYTDSGGIPEYCNGYGLSFDNNNFEIKLSEIISNYDEYIEKLKNYPFNSDKMCKEFLILFENLVKEKQNSKLDFKKGFNGTFLLIRNKTINKIKVNIFLNIQSFIASLIRKFKK